MIQKPFGKGSRTSRDFRRAMNVAAYDVRRTRVPSFVVSTT
jgi:hypothetical protein